MPKKLKTNHPVRQLYEILGLTQKQFAAQVGLASATISSMVRSKRRLSRKNAELIVAATGVLPASLYDSNGKPKAVMTGRPYCKEDYKAWRMSLLKEPPDAAKWIAAYTKILSKQFGAVSVVNPAKLSAMMQYAENQLTDIVEEFELHLHPTELKGLEGIRPKPWNDIVWGESENEK